VGLVEINPIVSIWFIMLNPVGRWFGSNAGSNPVGDVVYSINCLFINGALPIPLEVGDVNEDGPCDIADIVYLINYLFISGPPPGC